jgi:uncharacterized protein (TIGR02001 family)
MTMNNSTTKQGAMQRRLGVSALAVAALGLASAAQAQSDDGVDFGTFGGSASMSTDYVFRGISNTDEKPQVQVDFNWSHSSGVYAGVWGSNTDFGGDSSVEIDPYIGYAGSIGDTGFSYDVGYWQYIYPDSGDDRDYGEFYGIGTYSQGPFYVSPSVWFTPNYFGDDIFADDFTGTAVDVTVGWEFAWGIQASARIGEQTFGSDAPDDLEYTYFDAGVSKNLGGFDLGLRWHGTDGGEELAGDPELADDRLVFSVSRSF